MKYVITGITTTRNRGVEALLVTTIDQIVARDPGAQITVLTRDPEYDSHRCGRTGVSFVDHGLPLFSQSLPAFKRFLKRRVLGTRLQWDRVLAVLRASDVVIASGGDIFGSEYGRENLMRHLNVLRASLRFGRRVVFLGHSIGPFSADDELRAWRAVAEKSQLITLRESLSYEYVRDRCSLDKQRIVKTADVAFLLGASENDDAMLPKLGLDPQRPVIACAASQGIAHYSGMDAVEHRRSWTALLEHLGARLKAQVVLIPHAQDVSPRFDDRVLATEITRELSPAAGCSTRLAGGDLSAAEYKALIKQCELVIAERMHAGIAGLSSRVATVVVGYSVKAEGILREMLGPKMPEADVLIPAASFTDTRSLLRRVEHVFEARHRFARQLADTCPAVERAARANFDLLADLLLARAA